jgi:hypothetical protein
MEKLLSSAIVTTMVVEDVTGRSPSFTVGDRPFVTVDSRWEPEVTESRNGVALVPMQRWGRVRQVEDGIARAYLMVSDTDSRTRWCSDPADAVRSVRAEMRARGLLLSCLMSHPDQEACMARIADLGVLVTSSDSIPEGTVIGISQPRDVGVVAYSRQSRKAGIAFCNPLSVVSVRMRGPRSN